MKKPISIIFLFSIIAVQPAHATILNNYFLKDGFESVKNYFRTIEKPDNEKLQTAGIFALFAGFVSFMAYYTQTNKAQKNLTLVKANESPVQVSGYHALHNAHMLAKFHKDNYTDKAQALVKFESEKTQNLIASKNIITEIRYSAHLKEHVTRHFLAHLENINGHSEYRTALEKVLSKLDYKKGSKSAFKIYKSDFTTLLRKELKEQGYPEKEFEPFLLSFSNSIFKKINPEGLFLKQMDSVWEVSNTENRLILSQEELCEWPQKNEIETLAAKLHKDKEILVLNDIQKISDYQHQIDQWKIKKEGTLLFICQINVNPQKPQWIALSAEKNEHSEENKIHYYLVDSTKQNLLSNSNVKQLVAKLNKPINFKPLSTAEINHFFNTVKNPEFNKKCENPNIVSGTDWVIKTK